MPWAMPAMKPFTRLNLDHLARQGLIFQNCFVNTSICAISRANLLSGQYPGRHGIDDFHKSFTPKQLMQTVPARLQAAGYQTAFFGKWGIGDSPGTDASGCGCVRLLGRPADADLLLSPAGLPLCEVQRFWPTVGRSLRLPGWMRAAACWLPQSRRQGESPVAAACGFAGYARFTSTVSWTDVTTEKPFCMMLFFKVATCTLYRLGSGDRALDRWYGDADARQRLRLPTPSGSRRSSSDHSVDRPE